MEITVDRGLAIGGIVAGIILVVFDKAGEIESPVLLVLLGIAALMILPLSLRPWVKDTPWGMLKFSKMFLMVSIVGVCYSILRYGFQSDRPGKQVVKQLEPLLSSAKAHSHGKSEIVARVYTGTISATAATKAEYSQNSIRVFLRLGFDAGSEGLRRHSHYFRNLQEMTI
jgi:hypothetical protein